MRHVVIQDPVTHLGPVGRVLSFSHCARWRWMLWVTEHRFLVLDSHLHQLWVFESPAEGVDAASAVGVDGQWGVLYRKEPQSWEEAAHHNSILTGMNGCPLPKISPRDFWSHSGYLPHSLSCDLGSAILWAVRRDQPPWERNLDLHIRNPFGGISLISTKNVLDKHPTFPIYLMQDQDGKPIIRSSCLPNRRDYRTEVTMRVFDTREYRNGWETIIKRRNFSWTRLGGWMCWFFGGVGAWGRSSKTMYPTMDNTLSTAAMESAIGELWLLGGCEIHCQIPSHSIGPHVFDLPE